jgi:hypothetical protein
MATSPLETLIAALSDTSNETIDALRTVLATDVVARGLFVSAEGADALIDRIENPTMPVMSMAQWREPTSDEAGVSIVGDLPPGLPLDKVFLTIVESDGLITELVQEVVQATPAPADGIELGSDIAEFVNTAFERGEPLILGYISPDGRPSISYRGTIQTYGTDALALWARNPNGGLPKAIATNAAVSVLGNEKATRAHYVFEGRARIVTDSRTRDEVFNRSAEFERDLDAGKRGIAIIIELDSVHGGPLGATIAQRRKL